jgi:catechol 2,3-dioxygenase-like lactoylglutathione lyase family enzyme
MFSHIMVGTNDPDRAKTFYDAVLGTLGVPSGFVDKQPGKHRVFWRTKTGVFGVSVPIDGKEACHANGGTVGFACATPEQVHAFHEAGVKSGGTAIEDPPGLRPGPNGFYLAYLRDPDGNKICAMHRVKAPA